jgi:hypothetical protein
MLEISTVDPLHHQETRAFGLFDGMDGDDIRMIERRQNPRLTLEAIAQVGQLARQNFDRDLAPELQVVSQEDLAHATPAQGFDDAIVQQGLTDHGEKIRQAGTKVVTGGDQPLCRIGMLVSPAYNKDCWT